MRLGLQPVNKLPFSGLGAYRGGQPTSSTWHFMSRLPVDNELEISKIHVCKRVINGGELSDEQTFDVLLGMDVLTIGFYG